MNIFHKEIKKKFRKIYIPKLFNTFIRFDYSYIKELYEMDVEFVVIKVKYDTNIGIVGYDFLKYGDILNQEENIGYYFMLLTCEDKRKFEVVILDKSQVIFLPVKYCLRKLKILNLLNTKVT